MLFSLTSSPCVVGRLGSGRASLQVTSVLPCTAVRCHTMTLSFRLASQLLRWNENDMVFATLSFRRQFLR